MDNLPQSTTSGIEPPSGDAAPPTGGWAVAAGHGVEWWGSGWKIFRASPWIWIAITVLYLAIMFALSFIPILGQIASWVLYPLLSAGVLVGARAVDRGEVLTIGHLFSCFNQKAGPLLIVALLNLAGWFAIWAVAVGLLVAMVGVSTLTSLLSSDPAEVGVALLAMLGMGTVVVLLVAALLGLPLIMAYWFASALVLFRDDEPIAAMKASFVASMRNVPPFLVYSLLGIAFAIAASIPFALGWLVLMPVFAATIYASYKDIYGDPA